MLFLFRQNYLCAAVIILENCLKGLKKPYEEKFQHKSDDVDFSAVASGLLDIKGHLDSIDIDCDFLTLAFEAYAQQKVFTVHRYVLDEDEVTKPGQFFVSGVSKQRITLEMGPRENTFTIKGDHKPGACDVYMLVKKGKALQHLIDLRNKSLSHVKDGVKISNEELIEIAQRTIEVFVLYDLGDEVKELIKMLIDRCKSCYVKCIIIILCIYYSCMYQRKSSPVIKETESECSLFHNYSQELTFSMFVICYSTQCTYRDRIDRLEEYDATFLETKSLLLQIWSALSYKDMLCQWSNLMRSNYRIFVAYQVLVL